MTERVKYPHLENLERIPEFLEKADQLVITEKLHGFNARFGKDVDGTPWIGSRNQVILSGESVATASDSGLQGFVGYAKRILADDIFIPGDTFVGEWAGKGVQKGIDYGEKAFYLFAVHVGAASEWMEPTWLGWFGIELMASVFEMKTVPLEYRGPASRIRLELELLDEWRKAPSHIATGQQREGIVLVGEPMVVDDYGHPLIAKYKAPAFAETAHARKDKPLPADMENVQAFAEEYVTDERLGHVLAQVDENLRVQFDNVEGREDSLLVENTGTVLRAMVEDVTREGAADFAKLSETEQKSVGKVVNRLTKPMLDARRNDRLAA